MLTALMMGCEHTAPFAGVPGGAEGPLDGPGGEILTVAGGRSPTWSLDDQGILYVVPRRPAMSPPDQPGLPSPRPGGGECLALLPGGGGSAIWRYCNPEIETTGYREIFPSAAAGRDGAVLYVRARIRDGYPFPVGHVSDLVYDSGIPGTRPRRLLQLYRDHLGQLDPLPGQTFNWLTDLQFIDETRFLASAWRLRPDGTLASAGYHLGTISDDTTHLELIDVPAGALAATPSRDVVLVWNSIGTMQRHNISSGVSSTIAQLPEAGTRGVVDVDCDAAECLVLAVVPSSRTNFPDEFSIWRLGLQSMTLDSVTDFQLNNVGGVRISAARGAVVFESGAQLGLKSGLMGTLP